MPAVSPYSPEGAYCFRIPVATYIRTDHWTQILDPGGLSAGAVTEKAAVATAVGSQPGARVVGARFADVTNALAGLTRTCWIVSLDPHASGTRTGQPPGSASDDNYDNVFVDATSGAIDLVARAHDASLPSFDG